VLATSNICEGLRGNLTKYDTSSADLNPIGAFNKSDLRNFLIWFSIRHSIPALKDIALANPTAELRPFKEEDKSTLQSDEKDMGMTYDELDEFGKLRKIQKSGPVSMFERLLFKWPHLSARTVADKVKHFFHFYSINRHKQTVLTPSYHGEGYGLDDNRYDLRQFLYDIKWEVQFKAIDEIVEKIEADIKGKL